MLFTIKWPLLYAITHPLGGPHYAFVCDLSEQILPTVSRVSISGCSKILTVHVAIPVRDADAKNASSVKNQTRQIFISSVEQNGRLFVYVQLHFKTFKCWCTMLTICVTNLG